MKTFFYLSTCDTCKRIMKEINLVGLVKLQDIKNVPLTAEALEAMRDKSGSYEALFSKRARLYKERDLKNKDLKEDDYKALLLEHYTFLKRPVLVYDDDIFIGNSKSNVAKMKSFLDQVS